MIILCEAVRHDLEHQAVNSAMLSGLLQECAGEPAYFLAAASHLNAVLPDVPPTPHLHTIEIALPPRHAPPSSRWRRDFQIVQEVFALARKHSARAIVFFSVNPTILLSLVALSRGGIDRPTVGVMHGGLAEIASRRGRLGKFLPKLLRVAMSLASNQGVRYVVLEEVIRKRIQAIAPLIAKRTQTIPHPVPPDVTPIEQRAPAGVLHIALLGLATPQKGLFVFAECAHRFRNYGANQIGFHLIGRVHADFQERIHSFLPLFHTQPAPAPLQRSVYRELLSSMDYACFFFDGSHYDLTASGALLDCIAAGLPIIGKRNALLASIEAEVGSIGVLYDEPTPDAAVLRAAEARSSERYLEYRRNLLRAAAQRTNAATGQKLAILLSTKNSIEADSIRRPDSSGE